MDRPALVVTRRIDLSQCARFSLGAATIDPGAHEAIIGRRREHMQPQTMKVLVALHQQSGEVVSRDELTERCWDNRIVGEDVLNRCISVLRRFAASAGGFVIETVPKAGYRLVEAGESDRPSGSRWKLPALVGGIVAVAIAGVIATRADHEIHPPTIAMRPFTSGTDRQSRDLAAASGEALSHMLLAGTFVPRLNWPATPDEPLVEDFVLSGDVRQISGSFNVAVQMSDRRTGTIVFSRYYRATPATAELLPEQIGAEMSSNITGALAMMLLDRRRPDAPEVAAEYLKQIAMIIQGQDPLDAYQVSRQLAAKHPDLALTQLALAMSTGFALSSLARDQREAAVSRARAAAVRALDLNPNFGDSYYPWCRLHPQPRIGECESKLRAGMKADPDAPYLPMFLSDVLVAGGRYQEALSLARASLSDHPFQPHKLRRVTQILLAVGYEAEANEVYDKARKWWPNHPGIYINRIHGYTLSGDVAAVGRAAAEASSPLSPTDREAISNVVNAWRSDSGPALSAACKATSYFARLLCISALARTHDKKTAFKIADSLTPRLVTGSVAGDERVWLDDPDLGIEPILSAPAMRWLRSDPHYLHLIERVGLLAYWRSGQLPDFCRERQPEPVCTSFITR